MNETIDWFQSLPLYVQMIGSTAAIVGALLVERSVGTKIRQNDYRSIHLAYDEAVMEIRLGSASIAKYNFWRDVDSEKYMLRSVWVILDAFLLRSALLLLLLSEANLPIDVYRKVLTLLFRDHEVQLFSRETILWLEDRKSSKRFFEIGNNRQSMRTYGRSHVLLQV